jgi:crossover junction endodeoxyribonuclease RusA
VNNYYRHVGGKVLISAAGRKYRQEVVAILAANAVQTFQGDIELVVDAYPPDSRRRDMDNLEKCLWDALTAGGLVKDDYHIRRHTTERREPMPGQGGMLYLEARNYIKKEEGKR